MNQSRQTSPRGLRDLTVADLLASIPDPHQRSGGGAVAAITLAGAAAVTELVVTLAAGRRSLADRAAEFSRTLDEIRVLKEGFPDWGDRDLETLDELLDAHRAARRTPEDSEERARLNRAYLDAARVPIGLSRDAVRLLQIIDEQIPYSTRFTASDLGAAAALTRAAIEAALLTAETNLRLAHDSIEQLQLSIDHIRSEADELQARALAATVLKMEAKPEAGAASGA